MCVEGRVGVGVGGKGGRVYKTVCRMCMYCLCSMMVGSLLFDQYSFLRVFDNVVFGELVCVCVAVKVVPYQCVVVVETSMIVSHK